MQFRMQESHSGLHWPLTGIETCRNTHNRIAMMHLAPLTGIETLLYVHIYLDGLRMYLAPLRKLKRFYQFHFSLIKRTMHFYMIPIIYFS